MARNTRRKLTRIAWVGLPLVAVITLTFAFAAGRQPARPRLVGVSTTPTEAQALHDAALIDLQTLKTQVSFHPLLPPNFALPSGHLYDRVVWDPTPPVTGFGLFITSLANPSEGHDAIHMDEAVLTPAEQADPRNPLIAFKSILRAVQLPNGTWYEMQQQHDPNKGEWILTAQRGAVEIEVDGLDSKRILEAFAGSISAG
jgi:hypothetical protein